LSDADFVMDGSQPLDPRKTVFVGGVPRPLRAGNFNNFLMGVLFTSSCNNTRFCLFFGGNIQLEEQSRGAYQPHSGWIH